MRYWYLFLLFLLLGSRSMAQDSLQLDSLYNYELRLETLGEYQLNHPEEMTRIRSCAEFILNFKMALKVSHSFNYKFSKLKTVSMLYPKDSSFRLITWILPFADGTFRYYGFIQKKTKDGSLLFYPLYDASEQHLKTTDSTLNAANWYGCLYYDMASVKYKKEYYYLVYGWDGYNKQSNKKILDVLWFDTKGQPQFGKPVFVMKPGQRPRHRLIFEFNEEASMLLKHEHKEKIIAIENLVPPKPELKGVFPTYLPDGSYDYLKYKKGKWVKQKEQLFEKVRVGED